MNRVDIVCYTSKLCNLRCRYCYELPLLSDRSRMSFEQIAQMFANVEAGYRELDEPIEITFQWHGGEPLLLPPEVYRRIFQLQREAFAGSKHHIRNAIQSNFTVMDAERINLLREFDSVGVSLDLFTGLRVNKSGVCQEDRARENLQAVRDAGIPVGGITVLSRLNLAHMPEIYQFYRERGMAFRLLPLEKGLYSRGQEFEIGPRDVLDALCTIADIWLADDTPVVISPLDRYLVLVAHANEHPENEVALHEPEKWTSVLLVDTDGSVYTYGERFERSLGNIFTAPLDQIFAGSKFQEATEAIHARMRATCPRCPHYGRACTGDPVGESSQEFTEQEVDGSVRCVVARGIIQHLERRLTERGAITPRQRRAFTGRVLFQPS